MNNDPVLTLLGFAAKAGRLSYGTHATEWAITAKKANLVCVASDISEKSKKEIRFKANKQGIPVTELQGTDSATLSQRIGKRCGIVAVNDKGFAESIRKKI